MPHWQQIGPQFRYKNYSLQRSGLGVNNRKEENDFFFFLVNSMHVQKSDLKQLAVEGTTRT